MSRYLVESVANRLRLKAAEAVSNEQPFPTESELVEELDVSRTTVREAFSRLEAEGVVKRRHGTATAMNPAAVEISSALPQSDFRARLLAAGLEPSVRVIESGPVLVDKEVADRLQVDVGQPARRSIKLWSGGERPVMVEVETLLLPKWPMTINTDVSAPVGDAVNEIYGELPQWRVDLVDAVPATEALASMLEVDVAAPLLSFDGVLVTSTGQRVVHLHSYHRPGIIQHGQVVLYPERPEKP
ncbi:MAG: GntR family transcriptional regulator [Actinobacteria bacterium]|nr:GntR family transcriptional regulator [Actinomycetota bacterium]